MQIELGTQVERYTIEALIGEGGQGRVFRVRHMQLGTEHALKVMLNATPAVRERLLREGRAQARLRHPNIVNVSDVIDVRGNPGLVMEFIRGPALSDLLHQRELTLEQVDLLARGILEAVAHAHGHRFIHRDLKPDNIMCAVTPRGLVPKVMDFGLVKALGDDQIGIKQTRSGVMMGSAHYMSPEQIRSSKRADERSDVWALGVILYEMLTRRIPFDGGDDLFEIFAAITSGTYVRAHEHRSDIPPRMRRAIEAALVVDVDERVRDVSTLAALWRGDIESASESRTAARSAWDDELLKAYTDGESVPPPAPSGEFETWADETMDDAEASDEPALAEVAGTMDDSEVVPKDVHKTAATLAPAATPEPAPRVDTTGPTLADGPEPLAKAATPRPAPAAAPTFDPDAVEAPRSRALPILGLGLLLLVGGGGVAAVGLAAVSGVLSPDPSEELVGRTDDDIEPPPDPDPIPGPPTDPVKVAQVVEVLSALDQAPDPDWMAATAKVAVEATDRLTEPLTPEAAARAHLAFALWKDPTGVAVGGEVADHLAAAHAIDPDLRHVSTAAPAAHFASPSVPKRTYETVREPKEGALYFDGVVSLERPANTATWLQFADARGAVAEGKTVRLLPGDPMPAYETKERPPPPPPPPPPKPPKLGTLTVKASLGPGEYFQLMNLSGVAVGHGEEIPPGTYMIQFSSGAFVAGAKVVVEEGQSVVLRCSPDPDSPKCKTAVE